MHRFCSAAPSQAKLLKLNRTECCAALSIIVCNDLILVRTLSPFSIVQPVSFPLPFLRLLSPGQHFCTVLHYQLVHFSCKKFNQPWISPAHSSIIFLTQSFCEQLRTCGQVRGEGVPFVLLRPDVDRWLSTRSDEDKGQQTAEERRWETTNHITAQGTCRCCGGQGELQMTDT